MSRLSDNLNNRRDELKLKVREVHKMLNLRGHDVAFSTVAGWLNGSRGIRNVDHLLALCAVLQTDLNAMAQGEIEVTEGKVPVAVARGLRELTPAQQEAVLALVESMKARAG